MNPLNKRDLFTTNAPKKITFDLPDADVTLYENFFSPEESNELYERLTENIHWQQDYIQFYGKSIAVPRLSAWYGDLRFSYTYSGILMKPRPWNDDLLFIKERMDKEVGVHFSSCLLNLYRTGKDSVNWHQDNERELGRNPIIGSVSFGATRPFQLKHVDKEKPNKTVIPLSHGSFLLMKGTTQHYWKHQIPKTALQVAPRINLTYRIIK